MFIGGVILWLILCALVGSYAGKKGKSSGGYFFLSLILSPFIGFLIAALSESEKGDPNKIDIQIAKDSFIQDGIYKEDREAKGDWIIQERDSKKYVVVSTTRAFEFLIGALEKDERNVNLRNRLIEARQGKQLT